MARRERANVAFSANHGLLFFIRLCFCTSHCLFAHHLPGCALRIASFCAMKSAACYASAAAQQGGGGGSGMQRRWRGVAYRGGWRRRSGSVAAITSSAYQRL